MKNRRRETVFTREDLDSFFLWKVFWKLTKAETPLVFCLKVLACGVSFIAFIFFLILVGE